MKLTGNTVLVTGGTSGIGRALAEALHARGNTVIIAGRRRHLLDAVTLANPGMAAIELDIADPASIEAAASALIRDFPALNVLINNAGIMQLDDASGPVDEALLQDTLTVNIAGPIRMTGALIAQLKAQPSATIVNVTSVLGYVPLAHAAIYSATKAALHSWTLSLRWKLKDTGVAVQEIAPPWVQTDLLNSNDEPRAMPLAPFIAETVAALATDAPEVLVEIAKPLRAAVGPNEHGFVTAFNDSF